VLAFPLFRSHDGHRKELRQERRPEDQPEVDDKAVRFFVPSCRGEYENKLEHGLGGSPLPIVPFLQDQAFHGILLPFSAPMAHAFGTVPFP
jgi:hypothetical protein